MDQSLVTRFSFWQPPAAVSDFVTKRVRKDTHNVAILELHELGETFVFVYAVEVSSDTFAIYRSLDETN